MNPWKDFEGFELSNTTPIPDVFFDHLMQDCTGAELKVFLYIARRTSGFKKSSDAVSIEQLMNGIRRRSDDSVLDRGTGLSRPGVLKATAALEEKGLIVRVRQQAKHGGSAPTLYAIRFRGTPSTAGKQPLEEGGSTGVDPQETVNTRNSSYRSIEPSPEDVALITAVQQFGKYRNGEAITAKPDLIATLRRKAEFYRRPVYELCSILYNRWQMVQRKPSIAPEEPGWFVSVVENELKKRYPVPSVAPEPQKPAEALPERKAPAHQPKRERGSGGLQRAGKLDLGLGDE